VKPTNLSVCIWAIIIHTLVVIYVSIFGRVKFLWSTGYLNICVLVSNQLYAHLNMDLCGHYISFANSN
jgi:hypothetical protein